MGNQQPKKISRATKAQIDVGALKARIHLELMRDRKNNEVIKGQKQLINKIKAKNRNKTEQLLIAERVVNGLKYSQACNQLISYAASIRSQANFLSQNMLNAEKLAPWLPQIYSLIYAADLLGLSSLKQFKDLMRALNDPTSVNKYVNPQIIQLLQPTPSAEELNVYMLQFSERNNIPLEEINLAGHKFTKDWKPIEPSMKQDSFADLERKLAQQMANKVNIGGNTGGNMGGMGGMGGNMGGMGGNMGGNMGGFGGQGGFPNSGGFTPNNYYNIDKSKLNDFSNPYGIRQSYDPRGTQQPVQGPSLYSPEAPSNKPQQKPFQFTESRISIKSIDDIDYFPEIEPQKNMQADPDFDRICEALRAVM